MSKKCVKCGYIRQGTDTAPDYECPKCGVIYAKAEAAIAAKTRATAEASAALAVSTPVEASPAKAGLLNAFMAGYEKGAAKPTKGTEQNLCKSCGKDIGDARICPDCKEPQIVLRHTSKVKTAIFGVVLLVGVGYFLFRPHKPSFDVNKELAAFEARNSQKASSSNLPQTKSWCGIPKKNGTIAGRACDLEELCKDWVFFRREIYAYTAEGKTEKADAARRSFQQTNVWLTEYEERDTTACLLQFGG